MSNTWQLQDAKARFSRLIEATATEGPQVITKRGVQTAVVIPIDEWHRLQRMAKPDLKELLLAPEPRTETLTPPRRALQHRPPPTFD